MIWIIYAVALVFLAIFAIRPFIVSKRNDDQGSDQKSEKLPATPPFFPNDKVQFMNGGEKLIPGTVLEVSDDETDRGHQRVTIKFLRDPVRGGLEIKTVHSRKVILIERK